VLFTALRLLHRVCDHHVLTPRELAAVLPCTPLCHPKPACEDVPSRLQRAFDSIRTLDEEDAGVCVRAHLVRTLCVVVFLPFFGPQNANSDVCPGLLSNINALMASRLAEPPPTASDKPTDGAAAAGPSSKAGGGAPAASKKGKAFAGASSAAPQPGGVTSPMAVDAATQGVLDNIAAASGTLAEHGGTRVSGSLSLVVIRRFHIRGASCVHRRLTVIYVSCSSSSVASPRIATISWTR
jgi:hypothetical protein